MSRALRGFGISFDKDDPPRATRNKYNQAEEERGAIARYRAASDDHSVIASMIVRGSGTRPWHGKATLDVKNADVIIIGARYVSMLLFGIFSSRFYVLAVTRRVRRGCSRCGNAATEYRKISSADEKELER